ncbi:hypothetical protein [Salipaludibacillus keqinensis]|nr:hypothetical protein [Salipaludibacillus keqinensis]
MILGFSLKWSLPNETSEERPSGAGDIWWVQVPEIIESFRKTENDN